MPESDSSDSESKEIDSDSASDEIESPKNGGKMEVPEYEKQRLRRMEENRARMEALGLRKMASSLMGSVPNSNNTKKKKTDKKGKRKMNKDEDYRPEREAAASSNSSEEEDNYDNSVSADPSRVFVKKGTKTKTALKKNKKVLAQKGSSDKDAVDDEDALMKAIALSLQDSSGFLNVENNVPSRNSDTVILDDNVNEGKGNKGKRKRKKQINSRVQMTEDELIVHFFQFDEAGKGNINLRDLRRIAAAHDFTWSDMEMINMISFFDSDGDGKLSLDDFRKIVERCNMLQDPENVVIGSQRDVLLESKPSASERVNPFRKKFRS